MNQAAHVARKLRLPGRVARAYARSTPQNGCSRPAASRLETRTCAVPTERNVATPVSVLLHLFAFLRAMLEMSRFFSSRTAYIVSFRSQRACLRRFAVVLPDFRALDVKHGMAGCTTTVREVEGPLTTALINDRAAAASANAHNSPNYRARRGEWIKGAQHFLVSAESALESQVLPLTNAAPPPSSLRGRISTWVWNGLHDF